MNIFEEKLRNRPTEIKRAKELMGCSERELAQTKAESEMIARRLRKEEETKFLNQRTQELMQFADKYELLSKMQSIAKLLGGTVKTNDPGLETFIKTYMSGEIQMNITKRNPHLFYSIVYGSRVGFPIKTIVEFLPNPNADGFSNCDPVVIHHTSEGPKLDLPDFFGLLIRSGWNYEGYDKIIEVCVTQWQQDHRKLFGGEVFQPNVSDEHTGSEGRFSELLVRGYDRYLTNAGIV